MKCWLALIALIALHTTSWACTAFQLQSEDGAILYCRSMEYSFPLQSDLLVVGKNTPFTATAPNNHPGLKWRTKYGYVGMNQSLAPTLISDGLNEKGLVVGSLYLLGYAQYETPDPAKLEQTLGPWELGSYLLGNCQNIDEVKEALPRVHVVHEPLIADFVLPLHYYVTDKSGKVLIVEYLDGKLHLFENPIGVLTNAPPFSWHLYNLSNYVNLTPVNIPKLNLKRFQVQNEGEGTGLLGLPGDYTPPSRFIRAAFFSHWAHQQKTASDTARLGFHILNTFDIFDGIVRTKDHPLPLNSALDQTPRRTSNSDITEWTLVHDVTNLKTYFRSYESLKIQMVDLTKLQFAKEGFQVVPIKKSFDVIDESAHCRPLIYRSHI